MDREGEEHGKNKIEVDNGIDIEALNEEVEELTLSLQEEKWLCDMQKKELDKKDSLIEKLAKELKESTRKNNQLSNIESESVVTNFQDKSSNHNGEISNFDSKGNISISSTERRGSGGDLEKHNNAIVVAKLERDVRQYKQEILDLKEQLKVNNKNEKDVRGCGTDCVSTTGKVVAALEQQIKQYEQEILDLKTKQLDVGANAVVQNVNHKDGDSGGAENIEAITALEQSKREIDELNKQIKDSAIVIGELLEEQQNAIKANSDLKQACSNMEKMMKENEALKAQIYTDVDQNLGEMTNENLKLHSENQDALYRLESVGNELAAKREECAQHLRLIEVLQKPMRDIENELAEKRQQIQELVQEVERLYSSIEISNQNVVTLEEQLNKNAKDRKMIKKHMSKEISSVNVIKQKLKQDKDELHVQVNKLAKDKEFAEMQLVDVQSDNDNLKEEVIHLTQKMNNTSLVGNELTEKLQYLQLQFAAHGPERMWQQDGKIKFCSDCGDEFSVMLRKHHCRYCGFIFCYMCSNQSIVLPATKKLRRVCNRCYDLLGIVKSVCE